MLETQVHIGGPTFRTRMLIKMAPMPTIVPSIWAAAYDGGIPTPAMWAGSIGVSSRSTNRAALARDPKGLFELQLPQ